MGSTKGSWQRPEGTKGAFAAGHESIDWAALPDVAADPVFAAAQGALRADILAQARAQGLVTPRYAYKGIPLVFDPDAKPDDKL